MDDATARHYRTRSSQMADIYHSVDSIHLPHLVTLLRPGDRVLDIGCGTGRDVQWLRERGFDAVGVDATEEMLNQGRRRYNLAGEHISRDTLPALATVRGQFEAVTCISVLHHIGPTELLDALYRLRSLLAPGGFLVIKTPVRHSDVRGDRHADGRYYTLRNPSEYRFFLERLGLRRTASFDEHHDATDSDSCAQVFAAPLGTELNPMETVESVLWDDRKVNTYKFALIRAVADLASRRTRVGRWVDDGRVAIPTSEIAERWLEYYWPLIEPTAEPAILLGQKIKGKQDMAFRKSLEGLARRWSGLGGYTAFRAAMERGILEESEIAEVKSLIGVISRAIEQPVRYAGNDRTGKNLFEKSGRAIIISGPLWTELALMGRWVEDSVLLRWAEFVASLKHQDPSVTPEVVLSLLLRPRRNDHDTSIARSAYHGALDKTGALTCVWTEQPIKTGKNLAVDHAIPWSLWFTNALWNLLPVQTGVNASKSDRLPTRTLVESRRDRIEASWEILWQREPTMFRAHAGKLIGQSMDDFGRHDRNVLFDAFKNSIEFTAANRSVKRWEPE